MSLDSFCDDNKNLVANTLVDDNTLELCLFKVMASMTSDLMAIVDRQYIYHAANPSYLKAFGKTKEETIGKSVGEVLGRKQFESISKSHLDKALAGEDILFQAWVNFPKLKERYMDLHYAPVRDNFGEVKFCVATAHDITERKKAEDEKENLVNELSSALSEIELLRGIVPVCSRCKKVRRDDGYWELLEKFGTSKDPVEYKESLCPKCYKILYPS